MCSTVPLLDGGILNFLLFVAKCRLMWHMGTLPLKDTTKSNPTLPHISLTRSTADILANLTGL